MGQFRVAGEPSPGLVHTAGTPGTDAREIRFYPSTSVKGLTETPAARVVLVQNIHASETLHISINNQVADSTRWMWKLPAGAVAPIDVSLGGLIAVTEVKLYYNNVAVPYSNAKVFAWVW